MSLNVHTDIELTPPRHRKGACPFMVVFDKRSRPDNRGGIKQVFFSVPQDPTRTQKCSPGLTLSRTRPSRSA